MRNPNFVLNQNYFTNLINFKKMCLFKKQKRYSKRNLEEGVYKSFIKIEAVVSLVTAAIVFLPAI